MLESLPIAFQVGIACVDRSSQGDQNGQRVKRDAAQRELPWFRESGTTDVCKWSCNSKNNPSAFGFSADSVPDIAKYITSLIPEGSNFDAVKTKQ